MVRFWTIFVYNVCHFDIVLSHFSKSNDRRFLHIFYVYVSFWYGFICDSEKLTRGDALRANTLLTSFITFAFTFEYEHICIQHLKMYTIPRILVGTSYMSVSLYFHKICQDRVKMLNISVKIRENMIFLYCSTSAQPAPCVFIMVLVCTCCVVIYSSEHLYVCVII